MGLHTTIAPSPPPTETPPYRFAEPEDDEEIYSEEDGQCPECGSVSWQMLGYGRYSQYAYFTFGQSNYIDYDGVDTEGFDESDDWLCDNGHTASRTIADMLNDQ
jgi:hypothetical protein